MKRIKKVNIFGRDEIEIHSMFRCFRHMQERQLIFESVLPSELDPARYSKPVIDGIEQALTGNLIRSSVKDENIDLFI